MQQPFSLQGRVALITGGGTGIGFDIAKCFLASGATVVITGRREEVLKEAVANLGAGAHYAVNDVADLSLTSQLVTGLVAQYGTIDILVNNAGINMQPTSVEQIEDNDFERIISTNLTACWSHHIPIHVLPILVEVIMDIGHITTGSERAGGINRAVQDGWVPVLVTSHDDVG